MITLNGSNFFKIEIDSVSRVISGNRVGFGERTKKFEECVEACVTARIALVNKG